MGLKKRKKIHVLLLILSTAGLLWGGFTVTGTNRFCSSCHSMSPYALSLARDTAHREGDCVDCHLPAGIPARQIAQARLIVRDVFASLRDTENLYFASFVHENNCLQEGCHRNENWGENANKRQNPALKTFRHTTHFDDTLPDGTRIHCTVCHTGRRFERNSHFVVQTENCFPCHLAAPGNAPRPDIRPGNARCFYCHSDSALSSRAGHPAWKRGGAPAPGSSGLLDTISCRSCHPLFATATSAAAEENCLGCHPDWDGSSLVLESGMHGIHVPSKRADCLDCHLGSPHKELNNNVLSQMDCYECHGEDKARFAAQVAVYTGRAMGFTKPDPMAAAGVACSACHEQHGSNCADGKSACTKCHVAGYDKIVAIWQRTTRNKMARLMILVNKAIQEDAIEEIPPSMRQFLKVLKEDGSFGVHNIHAVNDLLNRGIESMLSLLPEEGR